MTKLKYNFGGDNVKQRKGRETFRKVITSDELISQINPINKELMERFLKNFSTKSAPSSVVNYRSNYNILFCWNLLYNENKSFIDFKKYELMDFFDFCLSELKWGPNRYAQMRSSLMSLSDWIENVYDEKYPNFRNIVKKMDRLPKTTVRKKSVFKKPELDKLMNWLGDLDKPNEQCLLALIMASGSRASELVRFTTSMIDENHTAFEGLFLETTEDIKVKGRGVNGKYIPRYIIKDIFLPYYKKWLPVRKQIMEENNQNHNFIFIKQNGEPAAVSTIRSWMEKWDDALDKHWYPHAGRHFWTSYLISIGLEKQLIQELQNWSSDQLVDIYNDNSAKDVKWKGLSKLRAELDRISFEEELNEIENNDED